MSSPAVRTAKVTAKPAPASLTSAGVPQPSSPVQTSEGLATPASSRTPRLLRQCQVVAVLVVLSTAALGIATVSELRNDLAVAPSLVDQYVRAGQIQHGLIEAGNLAGLAVVGGESATGSHATSSAAELVEVSSLLVTAAAARPADGPKLQEIAASAATYGQHLSAAVALPRAEATTRLVASEDELANLRTEVLQLQNQITKDATAAVWAQQAWWMIVAGLAALAVLGWISWVVAHRTHRVLNLGVVAAATAVLVITGLAVSAQNSAGEATSLARGSELERMVNLEHGTTQLAVARHVLVTAVLQQSWSKDKQQAYTTAFTAANDAFKAEQDLPTLAKFTDAHAKLAAAMAKGDWAAAGVALVDDDHGSLARLADDLQQTATETSAIAVQTAQNAADEVQQGLLWPLMLMIVTGLLGALLAIVGLSQRIKEYL